MLNIKAIFWDIDNTLVENSRSREAGFKAAIEAMHNTGLPSPSYEDTRRRLKRLQTFYENGWPFALLRLLCIEYGIQDKTVMTRTIEAGIAAFQDHQGQVTPKEGVADVLKELRRRGYRLGIISNSFTREQTFKLRMTGLLEYFDASLVLISSAMYKCPDRKSCTDSSALGKYSEEGVIYRVEKPWVTLFDEACGRVGCGPEEILYVGDLLSDVVGSKVAGCRSALLADCRPVPEESCVLRLEQPDYLFHNVSDILQVLT